jgi:hypothetical protein
VRYWAIPWRIVSGTPMIGNMRFFPGLGLFSSYLLLSRLSRRVGQ